MNKTSDTYSMRLPIALVNRIQAESVRESVKQGKMVSWAELVREALAEKFPAQGGGQNNG